MITILVLAVIILAVWDLIGREESTIINTSNSVAKHIGTRPKTPPKS